MRSRGLQKDHFMNEQNANVNNMQNNIAIFWDIENVTPKYNSLFIDGMLEFAESLGKVVISNAYADWTKGSFRNLAHDLVQHNFYMIHLPQKHKRLNKNGADIQLVSDALDTLRVYEHIDTYLLITGDSDFRPLLRPLRRMGKKIHIICDLRTASQDLLMIADSFTDYHSLIPSNDEEDEVESPAPAQRPAKFKESKDGKEQAKDKLDKGLGYWYNQLVETVSTLQKEDKSLNFGSMKVKMRMLNPGFDERRLGFRTWSHFVTSAVSKNYISIDEKGDKLSIRTVKQEQVSESITLQKAFMNLIEVMKVQDAQLEEDERPGYHSFALLNSKLRERGIDVRDLEFSQFKKFMASAEARGLIDTKLENLNHFAKILDDK